MRTYRGYILQLLNPKSFDKMGLPEDHSMRKGVEISNPLSEEHSVMRTSLIPNLLEIAQRNVSRKVLDLSIFEFGRVFHPGEETGSLLKALFCRGWLWAACSGLEVGQRRI